MTKSILQTDESGVGDVETQVPIRVTSPLRLRFLLFALLLTLVAGVYHGVNHFAIPQILDSYARQYVGAFVADSEVRAGSMEMNGIGDIIIYDVDVYSSVTGVKCLVYHVDRIVLSFNGFLLVDRDAVLTRVEFHRPVFYAHKPYEREWNVMSLFLPSTHDGPTSLPVNGIHIYDGTISASYEGKQSLLFTGKAEQVFFRISERKGLVTVSPVTANVYGGRATAHVTLFENGAEGFSVTIEVWDARLEKIVQGTLLEPYHMRGAVEAVFAMEVSKSETDNHAVGSNYILIHDGHIWDLPVFFNILKLLSLRKPENASFDEVLIHFTVDAYRLHIQDMKLLGYPVSLVGDGGVDLDGNHLEIVFLPMLGKEGLDDTFPLIGAPIQLLLNIAKGTLVPVVLSGTFTEPEISVDIGRPIFAPIRALFSLFSGK